MYHIKSDKRMHTSARLIIDGLMTCLQTKKFDNVTITDVQRVSGVGRSTFYRLFDNLSDVLMYQTDQLFASMIAEQRTKKDIDSNTLMNFFVRQWLDNTILLETLIDSHRDDILLAGFENSFTNLKDFLLPDKQLDSISTDYFIGFVASVVVGGLKTWIKRGKTESPAILLAQVRQASDTFLLAQKTSH
ncbi:TetR/AcrR family transcriptional regulator [Lactiplantibacillus herbarum]|uniref:TetR/AcrR family transcriptional regulator n=1 Tax=Lactiplantibacillus herbarum TaxID=1670446 RepID=UPI000A6A2EB2|nr:TetR/AcrR family transcriptional regulator [Lactiplantibacillus herbarum]